MRVRKMKRHAYLYSRVSTLQQVDGFGIKRQINTITDFLKYADVSSLGYELDTDNFTVLDSDLGKSAYKGNNWKPKSSLGRFYLDVKEGRIKEGVLIVENIDRLTRKSTYEQSELMYLINHGIDVLEVETGMAFSFSKPETGQILSMTINRAFGESKRKSRMGAKSWESKRQQFKERGGVLSKYFPRWLKNENDEYRVKAEFADTICAIFQMYSDGYSVSSIRDYMNQGLRFDQGRVKGGELLDYQSKPWERVSLHKLLRDRRVLGELVVGTTRSKKMVRGEEVSAETEIIKQAYPQIVDDVLFDRVQMQLDSKKKTNRTTKHMHSLFNGIAKCQCCGSPMVAGVNGWGKLFLKCNRKNMGGECTAKFIPYKELEFILLKAIDNIDWSLIYTSGGDSIKHDNAERELKVLKDDLEFYTDSEVKARGTPRYKGIIHEIEVLEESIKTKIGELELMKSVGQKVDMTMNLDAVLNHDNVELRRDTNVRLRRVIKEIKIRRIGSKVICDIQYFTELHRYLYVIDLQTTLVHWIYRDNKGVCHYKYSSALEQNMKGTEVVSEADIADVANISDWDEMVNKLVVKYELEYN